MKTLLFDYGGTLDTAAKHWYYVFEEAYKAVGLQIPDNELRQAYVFGERYLAKKPEPAIWQLGVKTANASAANCIAIGDSYSKDIVPAHASGIETIWFKGKEWEDKDYDESLPTHIITSLTDILQIL